MTSDFLKTLLFCQNLRGTCKTMWFLRKGATSCGIFQVPIWTEKNCRYRPKADCHIAGTLAAVDSLAAG
jgi:hypothetical protein